MASKIPQVIKIILPALLLVLLSTPTFASRHKVMRVIDGDTIDVDYFGKKERIRLLRVNTPESVHPDRSRNSPMGKKASDFAKKILTGKSVDLEFEGRQRGRYGRLLAYVILDGRNFNLELVRRGWSRYYTKYGRSERYDREFREAENHARAMKLHIWNPAAKATEPVPGKTLQPGTSSARRVFTAKIQNAHLYHGNIKTRTFHAPGCRYFNCKNCTLTFMSRTRAMAAGYSPCKLCRP